MKKSRVVKILVSSGASIVANMTVKEIDESSANNKSVSSVNNEESKSEVENVDIALDESKTEDVQKIDTEITVDPSADKVHESLKKTASEAKITTLLETIENKLEVSKSPKKIKVENEKPKAKKSFFGRFFKKDAVR